MERLSDLILQAAPTATVGLDLQGRIVFANPAAARLLGSPADEDLVGLPIQSYVQFLSLGASGLETCVREDGASFPVEYESAPLLDGCETVGTVVTLRDITQRLATARQKDELISIVSHELRTPLTSIRSALGLMASGHLGEQPARGQRMLDIAVTNMDRLIRLINDMLDLERLNSGEESVAHSLCDAGDLMLLAADSVRRVAEDAGVRLNVTPVSAGLLGDRDRLQQVLINLLANAVKFSPSDGGSVWLDAEASPAEIVFRVRDEGRGIPSNKIETIFERFAQVDASDSREKGGTGLGLAICRAIVTQHGGQIWAESTPGSGTTICVALPRGDVARTSLERAA